MNTQDGIEKGAQGESALNDWFNNQGLGFVHVSQSTNTFATLFTDAVKRPDFLLLFDSIGLLAVDAKYKGIYEGCINGTPLDGTKIIKRDGRWVSLKDKSAEIGKALAFERIFRMPFWYAFLEPHDDGDKWYWISALKALEVGMRVRDKQKEEFLVVALEDCICITNGDDLGKLYLQRTNLSLA